MPAPRVRADHDSLRLIAQAMGQQSEASRRTLDRLRRAKEALQGGDWIGVGAKAFYREMDSEVLPSMGRLVSALERSAEVTRTISQIMKQAEDEAARLFQLVGAAAATAVAGGGRGAPPPPPGTLDARAGAPATATEGSIAESNRIGDGADSPVGAEAGIIWIMTGPAGEF